MKAPASQVIGICSAVSSKKSVASLMNQSSLAPQPRNSDQREWIMNLSIELPTILKERLADYCRTHGVSEDQAIEQAVRQLLGDSPEPTPYDLGAEGFGADRTHSGDIAQNSKRLLRERFREPSAG